MLCFLMFSCVRVSVFYVAFMDAVFMCACESKITEPLKGHGQKKIIKIQIFCQHEKLSCVIDILFVYFLPMSVQYLHTRQILVTLKLKHAL